MSTASAQQAFESLVRDSIGPWMKDRGWSRDGATFRLRQGDNVAIVQLTRNPWSRQSIVWFWVKAGVWSARLGRVDEAAGCELKARPGPDDGHWTLPYDVAMRGDDEDGPPLIEWEIKADASDATLQRLVSRVRQRLDDVVLPAVLAHLDDEAILEGLLEGDIPLQGDRAEYTLALIHDLDRPDLLPRAERALEPATGLP